MEYADEVVQVKVVVVDVALSVTTSSIAYKKSPGTGAEGVVLQPFKLPEKVNIPVDQV